METPKLQAGDLIVTSGKKLHQRVIQWWTYSRFNHIGIILNAEGDILEAVFPKVRIRNIEEYRKAGESFSILRLKPSYALVNPAKMAEAIEWARGLEGKAYDWRGIIGLGLRCKLINRKGFYFCSETAYQFWQVKLDVEITRQEEEYFTPQNAYESVAFYIAN